jgi:hypothetical protein
MAAFNVLVGLTAGLAGFLLFLVEPMMGKYILPWFGGSASTWSVCLLFFQGALLVGYFYALAISERLPLRIQSILQLVLLGAAILMLPILPSESWKPVDASAPAQRILATLTVSVGLPYAVLATTSPLLQRWVSLLDPTRRVTRYFAISNFGSFLGLLSFPFLVEPMVASPQQAIGWSFGFGAYAFCFAACAIFVTLRRNRSPKAVTPAPADETNAVSGSDPSAGALPGGGALIVRPDIVAWIGWATGGTVLLLASTNLVTEWITVVPLLWVLPLALYLLTFVLVFSSAGYYRREVYLPLFVILAVGSLFIGRPETTLAMLTQIALLSACMFTGCMICHGELVAKTPVARLLTGFYLAISFGGFLGGMFVAFVAPAIFPDVWEYQLGILAVTSAAIFMEIKKQGVLARRTPKPVFYGLALVFVTLVAGYIIREFVRYGSVVWQTRNFYGVVKVIDNHDPALTERFISMFQSGENQGEAWVAPELQNHPSCDFGEYSALGLALRYVKPRREGGANTPIRVGFIGLGVGMSLGYAKPGDVVRFYELNPAVADAASEVFPFIRNSKATVDIILGDGRLSVERESKAADFQKFDILVLDAFRGSSPPMHLMTKEAYDIYLSVLKPDGILAVDLDLWNFELSPLHRGLAQTHDLQVGWFDTPDMVDGCDGGISWALYTRDQGFWKIKRVAKNRSDWPDHSTRTIVWTDKNTNLLSVICWTKACGAP